ncbi:MAG TPA: MlaA family lipoprotein [Methylomirabilota bacterium]|nr:MlaA family lipoprotein [Methylomirabilota bacterium]
MRRRDWGSGGTGTLLLWVVFAVGLGGCGTFSGFVKSDDALTAGRPLPEAPAAQTPASPPVQEPEAVALPAVDPAPLVPADDDAEWSYAPVAVAPPLDAEPVGAGAAAEPAEPVRRAALPESVDGGSALAQRAQDSGDALDEEYDPWEPFNEKMFEFNRGLDRWILKPAARAYMVVMPEPWQVLIANGFDNINFVPRFVNSLLQGKWGGAGRELGRFLINSTAGIGGLFDPAKDFWGIPKSREDFGQTLGVWGSGPGPYLVLPLLEPLTVRDGIGKFVDGLMDPLSYVLPFLWTRVGMKAGDTLNDRALNYDLFQGFEESVIDMYSAVRHGYLQRRQQLIKE